MGGLACVGPSAETPPHSTLGPPGPNVLETNEPAQWQAQTGAETKPALVWLGDDSDQVKGQSEEKV